MKLLDIATRRLLERLRLPVNAKATAARQGGHRSPVMASGLEFADHRQYVPGDDFRQIDWNAFARHRELVIRQFEEERDARIYVLYDVSASMTRGEPPKVDVARRMAAAFSYLGMKQFDVVRLIPFADSMETPSRALGNRTQLPEAERFLVASQAAGVTSFGTAVRDFAARFPRRGHAIVVSDLMTPDGWDEGFRVLGGLGHQVTVLRVTCDEDDKPDFRGEIELFDSETGERLRVRMSAELIASYRRILRDHVETCRDAAQRVGGRLIEAPVTLPTDQLVLAALAPPGAGRAA